VISVFFQSKRILPATQSILFHDVELKWCKLDVFNPICTQTN